MDEKLIEQLCLKALGEMPDSVSRCSVGTGNYVYIAERGGEKYVVRCNEQENAYKDTLYWLEKLQPLDIPVPKVIAHGSFFGYEYIILSYFEGEDIGQVYRELTDEDKRAIAKDVVSIQKRAETLEISVPPDWSWLSFVDEMLDRAEARIRQNGWFDPERVQRLRAAAGELREYFEAVKPVAYLDDISSKNLIVHKGRISGIVDVDWIGVGDKLTYVALTNTALLNMDCDRDYVDHILDEMQPSEIEKRAFLFYTLLYCVDFMGERGMDFMGRTVAVSPEIIARLNDMFDSLWAEWTT